MLLLLLLLLLLLTWLLNENIDVIAGVDVVIAAAAAVATLVVKVVVFVAIVGNTLNGIDENQCTICSNLLAPLSSFIYQLFGRTVNFPGFQPPFNK